MSELIFITGHLKEQVEAYARARYTIPSRFIEQKVQDGTAGAVNLARPHVREPVLIIFVDTVFEADLTLINRTDADGIIWAKEVEDYQRFGVVVTDAQGLHDADRREADARRSRSSRTSASTTSGNWTRLWQGIDHTLAQPEEQGRVLPHRRVPVHDRPRPPHPDRRGGRLVRLRRSSARMLETNEIAAPERRRAAPGLSRRHDPRSGVHRGRGHHRAQHGRAQRVAGAGHQRDATARSRNAIVGRTAGSPASKLDGAMLGNHVVAEGIRGAASPGRSFGGDRKADAA